MKTPIIILAVGLLIPGACSKPPGATGTRKCLDLKIAEYSKSSSCDDASVKEYRFKEETVFVFEPGTCGADMTSEVIDMNCNTLGHLGGLTANTKIKGAEFSEASYVKTVWKK
jgi:hypothetical protein